MAQGAAQRLRLTCPKDSSETLDTLVNRQTDRQRKMEENNYRRRMWFKPVET